MLPIFEPILKMQLITLPSLSEQHNTPLIPALKYAPNTVHLKSNGDSTFRMIERLQKLGYTIPSSDYFLPWLMFDHPEALVQHLRAGIDRMIVDYIKSNNQRLLVSIFHHIQAYGGTGYLSFYEKGNGLDENFNVHTYEMAVHLARQGTIDDALTELIALKHFNLEQASTHLAIWTSALQGIVMDGPRQLPPITDTLQYLIYGGKPITWNSYGRYVNDLYTALALINNNRSNLVELSDLVEYLKAYAQSKEGVLWIARRIAPGKAFIEDKTQQAAL
jgi:hypothetical protein